MNSPTITSTQDHLTLNKMLFHLSWLSSLYIIFLCVDAYLIKSSFILFGVIRELFTLPLIGAQLVIFIVALIFLARKSTSPTKFTLWAVALSLGNMLFVVASFLGWIG